MKMIITLILLLHIVFLNSCISQTREEDIYSTHNFFLIDSSSTNEMDLLCKMYSSKIRENLAMQECFWDSSKKKLASRHFKMKGNYNGPCWYWDIDGNLTIVGNYLNNKKNEKWIYYFAGKVTCEGEYKNGKKVGVWRDYDSDGKLVDEINYGEN